ncbi:hypothetical protein AGDE_12206 [Angomonas deanei]|uniref:Uncharacterized protein n=1 Tax=Angomonas deanei TaxID=59799 RepID=A0A7G2CKE8_9TRYP|nr:hypothetical protein AGDE_12206 [Angomonas deanei]CAD2219384.1 hypothetical protein, conserved [Angomonas deanei]|eukprot:EPY24718.1 hypothetical protein AGDE_12206 [Angomonas deanei]
MPPYDPWKPNRYGDVKYAQYAKRRQRQQAEATRSQFAGDFIAEALQGAHAHDSVNLPAEDLHRLRIKTSAEMGVKRAVELEREEHEVEQKRKKLEGSDVRGKIGGLLEKMKQASSTNASKNALSFQPSAMAAGGYVLKEGSDTKKITGKPSSIVQIRTNNLAVAATLSELRAAPKARQDQLLGLATEKIRAECGKHGTVRSAVAHVLPESGTDTKNSASAVRFFIRFDTVADAFKAVDYLLTQEDYFICFYPLSDFAAEKYDSMLDV